MCCVKDRMTKIVARPKTIKYLSNKELLAEIARCKKNFCTFTAPEYSDYDAIISQQEVSEAYMVELMEKLNAKLPEGEAPKTRDGLVFRVMTYDHVPLDPDRKRKSRATNQSHARTNFPPFKHFLYNVDEAGNETWTEVGRSHWRGAFDETGEFTVEKGRMSERLGMMFMMLVDKYSSRSNWRGYTYRDEMRGLALAHLAQVGLQFDESKSNNPFAFFTTTITHCFTRTLNIEKKNQAIRDDLLIHMGMSPSYTRQIENEMSQNGIVEPKKLPAKRGRKSAAQLEAIKVAEAAEKAAKDSGTE
jgi:hypothetical protein